MRNDPLDVTWQICCADDEADAVARSVHDLTSLDRELIDSAIAFPNGATQERRASLHLGDHFESIRTERRPQEGGARWSVTFRRRNVQNGRWKDVMLEVVRSLREAGESVTVEMVVATASDHAAGPKTTRL